MVPLILAGLYGGALADAMDRRRLLLLSELGLAVATLMLLVNAVLPQPAIWPLYLNGAAVATMFGLQRPALFALIPRVVTHDQIPAANALMALQRIVGTVIGPALAGAIVTLGSLGTAYALDLATFSVSLLLLWGLRAAPRPEGTEPVSLRSILEGLRYAWQRKDLLGSYLVDLSAMFLAMPLALLPFLADELHAPWSLGTLYAAEAVGALLATLASGLVLRANRHGRGIALAAASWGACLGLIALVLDLPGALWLVVALLVAAGAADMVSGLYRSTLWNQTIPDEIRGRMGGIELLSYSVGPMLGQVRAGAVASVIGVGRPSGWAGSAACWGWGW